MRKRLLCLLLAGMMIISTAVPALADNTESVSLEDVVSEESVETFVEDSDVTAEPEGTEDEISETDADVAVDSEILEDVIPETVPEADDTPEGEVKQEVVPEVSDEAASVPVTNSAPASEVIEVPEESVVGQTLEAAATSPYEVKYQAHVQNIGWMSTVSSLKNGAFAGTTGKNLWMESLKIDSNGLKGLTYSAHVAEIGWMDFVSADNKNSYAGTTGRSLSMEAIKIKLEGENAEKYDVYYRAHVTNFGWLGWAKNGEAAGSAGYAYTLQALEIKVLPKGQTPKGYEASRPVFREKLRVFHNVSSQNIGWIGRGEAIGTVLGTTGRDLYMDAIRLETNGAAGVGIAYSTHISNVGWTKEVSNGKVSGKSGSPNSIEAIKIWLTGENADQFDVYYQAHVTNIGWLDWTKNGAPAGSSGMAYTLQAIRVVVQPKGSMLPGELGLSYATKMSLSSQGYSKNKGWLNKVGNGSVIGITGKGLPLQAFKLNLSGIEDTTIQYSAHVSNVGWQNFASSGKIAGLEGKQQIEAIKIKLNGPGSKYYDVWYRVHSANVGWLDWAKNGEPAGTAKLSYAAEAIQVTILPKGSAAPGSTESAYVESKEGWVYINGYRRYRDAKGNILKDVSHIFNPSNKRITVDCYNGITTVYGYNSETGSYDTPINAFLCSVGRLTDKTPSGTYRIYRKYESKIMNGRDGSYSVWAPYISCFNGAIYFHGVASIDRTPNQIGHGTWGALGSPASSGCVRLAGIEAKWVYENCPIGTSVYVGSYSQGLDCPITNPTRYAWTSGDIGPDPTL